MDDKVQNLPQPNKEPIDKLMEGMTDLLITVLSSYMEFCGMIVSDKLPGNPKEHAMFRLNNWGALLAELKEDKEKFKNQ